MFNQQKKVERFKKSAQLIIFAPLNQNIEWQSLVELETCVTCL
jgi:hypothetical protein